MSEESQLARIAEQLVEKEIYFSKHKPECLQAFIRDKGKCVYCPADLFESYDTASATDHLIPRSLLKKNGRLSLLWDVRNLVASCAECNTIKHNFDPSHGDIAKLFDECKRREMIAESAQEIERRKKATPDWRSIFVRAKENFQKSVEEYKSTSSS